MLLIGCSKPVAQVQPDLALTGRVVDRADLLDPEAEAALTENLAALERRSNVQLVVATTTSLGGRSIEDYSLSLARAWALGSKDRNNGLLLLVAPRERKVRIEVGTGLELTMKDEICARIIRRDILPDLKVGQMQRGIKKGVRSIVDVLDRSNVAAMKRAA